MSGKKNLLNEAQVRKFMKLARLEPLTQGFVDGLTETTETEEELEELRTGRTGALGPKGGGANPGHGRGQGEAANGSLFEEEGLDDELDATEEDELGAEDEFADEEGEEIEDLEGEEEMGAPEGGEGRMVSVDDFLTALETALEDAIGDEVEIDSEEMPEEEPGGEEVMDAEVEMGPEGEEAEMGMEEEPLQEKKEEDLVEQITKRVAARILKSALKK